jgi:hypothetical protein
MILLSCGGGLAALSSFLASMIHPLRRKHSLHAASQKSPEVELTPLHDRDDEDDDDDNALEGDETMINSPTTPSCTTHPCPISDSNELKKPEVIPQPAVEYTLLLKHLRSQGSLQPWARTEYSGAWPVELRRKLLKLFDFNTLKEVMAFIRQDSTLTEHKMEERWLGSMMFLPHFVTLLSCMFGRVILLQQWTLDGDGLPRVTIRGFMPLIRPIKGKLNGMKWGDPITSFVVTPQSTPSVFEDDIQQGSIHTLKGEPLVSDSISRLEPVGALHRAIDLAMLRFRLAQRNTLILDHTWTLAAKDRKRRIEKYWMGEVKKQLG